MTTAATIARLARRLSWADLADEVDPQRMMDLIAELPDQRLCWLLGGEPAYGAGVDSPAGMEPAAEAPKKRRGRPRKVPAIDSHETKEVFEDLTDRRGGATPFFMRSAETIATSTGLSLATVERALEVLRANGKCFTQDSCWFRDSGPVAAEEAEDEPTP